MCANVTYQQTETGVCTVDTETLLYMCVQRHRNNCVDISIKGRCRRGFTISLKQVNQERSQEPQNKLTKLTICVQMSHISKLRPGCVL